MIEFREVSVRAGQFSLFDVSFRIERGEYAVLMGRTGGGKTTLLEILCGLRPLHAGQVLIDGQDVTDWPPGDRQIGYVPQDLALFPTMNVQEHLAFALRLRHVPRKLIQERVAEMAELLGITHLLPRMTHRLSGGESQRVALGRALSFQPSVLLLDEPLSALDEATREDMHALLGSVQERTGVTALHVTHSRHEAEALADRFFIIEEGQVREASLTQN